MNHFLVIDVETANTNHGTICQIGIVECKAGSFINSWCTYLNPNTKFNDINISIHGITPEMVMEAPTFAEIYESFKSQITNMICCSYGHFDKSAIGKACEINRLDQLDIKWIDVLPLAREQINKNDVDNYSLSTISKYIGFDFKHHDALEDAKACAAIILEILKSTKISIEELYKSHGSSKYKPSKKPMNEHIPDTHFNRIMKKRWNLE